ncbi:hypothetical protein OSTOST_01073 [Ostertagia ostertagi]
MTYDYRSDEITGVAPYSWVEQSLAAVLEHSPELSKYVMIGLNHYGYEFIGHSAQPIQFDRYIENLKRTDSKLEWDSKAKEHVLKFDLVGAMWPIMTYDYRSDEITGVAPYSWVEQSLAAVLEHSPELSKYVMIGLNHYGYEFIGHSAQPIQFDR